MPRYEHDCKECHFVGEDQPRDGKEGKNYIDVYFHMGWREGVGFLTRRWGSGKYDKDEKSLQKIREMTTDSKWSATWMFAVKRGVKI